MAVLVRGLCEVFGLAVCLAGAVRLLGGLLSSLVVRVGGIVASRLFVFLGGIFSVSLSCGNGRPSLSFLWGLWFSVFRFPCL